LNISSSLAGVAAALLVVAAAAQADTGLHLAFPLPQDRLLLSRWAGVAPGHQRTTRGHRTARIPYSDRLPQLAAAAASVTITADQLPVRMAVLAVAVALSRLAVLAIRHPHHPLKVITQGAAMTQAAICGALVEAVVLAVQGQTVSADQVQVGLAVRLRRRTQSLEHQPNMQAAVVRLAVQLSASVVERPSQSIKAGQAMER
jgi:hypothetical protein